MADFFQDELDLVPLLHERIKKLEEELESRDAEVSKLYGEVSTRDLRISKLEVVVDKLEENIVSFKALANLKLHPRTNIPDETFQVIPLRHLYGMISYVADSINLTNADLEDAVDAAFRWIGTYKPPVSEPPVLLDYRDLCHMARMEDMYGDRRMVNPMIAGSYMDPEWDQEEVQDFCDR